MRFVHLAEITIDPLTETTIDKGSVFLNLAAVRKIIKVRRPDGRYATKLSYLGLGREDDILVDGTPEEIAAKVSGKPELPSVSAADFKPTRTILARVPEVEAEVPVAKEAEIFHSSMEPIK